MSDLATEMLYPFILVALSILQSLIGVGVLLFGTPIFLLFGIEFFDVLTLLLPVSICLSFFTYISNPNTDFNNLDFTILCISVAIGTLLSVEYLESFLLLIVAVLLAFNLVISATNFIPAKSFFDQYKRTTVGVLGLVHGMSNQGGIILVLITKTKKLPKDLSRSSVASAYGLLAFMQLVTLIYLDSDRFISNVDMEGLIAAILGFFLGNRIFNKMKQKSYESFINLSIIVFIFLLTSKFLVGW